MNNLSKEVSKTRDEVSQKRKQVQDLEAENDEIKKSAKISFEIAAVNTMKTNELDELEIKLKDSLSAIAIRR